MRRWDAVFREIKEEEAAGPTTGDIRGTQRPGGSTPPRRYVGWLSAPCIHSPMPPRACMLRPVSLRKGPENSPLGPEFTHVSESKPLIQKKFQRPKGIEEIEGD